MKKAGANFSPYVSSLYIKHINFSSLASDLLLELALFSLQLLLLFLPLVDDVLDVAFNIIELYLHTGTLIVHLTSGALYFFRVHTFGVKRPL